MIFKECLMAKRLKVAISGAAGQIGYALIFRIASGQMFGPQTEVELHLLELAQALPALQGVAMELEDCAFPLLKNILITADLNEAMRDINWAILVGAMPRQAGMERADLLQTNGQIFMPQGRAINEQAAENVQVLVVGNPCNTNCLIAMHSAPDVPRDRFYAMTLLDELRARTQLAKKAGVAVTTVTQMTIWGNHSSTQYPDFYHAHIQGLPAHDVITDLQWLQNEFIPTIQQRGAAVIKARGASSAASAANAALMTVFHLTHDTVPGETFSVARCSQGEYGIEEGLICSVPCRIEQNQLKVVTGLTFNAFAQQKLDLTLNELRQERDTVKTLKLIS
jgi:malate dehydrogenase